MLNHLGKKSPCQVDYHQLSKALEAKTSVSKLYMLNAYAFTVLLRQSLHSGFRNIKHERKVISQLILVQ